VHRVQRIPPGDTRRHTSTVTVAVLDEDSPDCEIDVDSSEVRVECYRDSGPGGQHRNTSDSAVRLTHLPTGVVVCATESRSQGANRAAAWVELRRRLAVAAADAAAQQRNGERVAQIGSGDRAEVTWTWNDQRGQVTHHPTRRRWRWKDLSRGRWQ
jgi:peptide chain release factor 1